MNFYFNQNINTQMEVCDKMATARKKFKSPGRRSTWLEFNTAKFDEWAKDIERTYDLAQQITMKRVGFHFRKEAHGVIDRGKWAKRKLKDSSKIDIKLAMKTLVRFKITESDKHGVYARMGVFPGKVFSPTKKGKRMVSNLKNDAFVFKYGLQVAQFAQAFIYGGKVPVLGDFQRKALRKLGLHIADSTDHLTLPKRNWIAKTPMMTAPGITKYINKVFPDTFKHVLKGQIKKGNVIKNEDGSFKEVPVAKGFSRGNNPIEVHDKDLNWIMSAQDIDRADVGMNGYGSMNKHTLNNAQASKEYDDFKSNWDRNPPF